MIWILVILGIALIIFLSGCKKPVTPEPNPEPEPPEPTPIPDPTGHKWQLVDKTTERWKRYVEGMKNVTTDTLLALELIKKDENGKYFYVWTAEAGDYWETPDEVYEIGKVDCDGFARFVVDVIGRFIMLVLKLITDVWWLEYYGYYRHYYYDKLNDKWTYDIKLGGHAIAVYRKDGELLAFSNTNWWWNKNFQDFVEIGEETFPEGIVLIRCRHWETGKLQWVEEAEQGEILKGSCVFDRKRKEIR